MTNTPAPLPDDPLEEHERQTAVSRIQRAMADGHLDFEQLDDRFDKVFRAENRAELTAAVADLPVPAAPGRVQPGQPIAKRSFSLFGDLKAGGWIDVDSDMNYTTIFGDVVIDLSSADLPRDLTVSTFSLFGDATLIVPDGVRASIETLQVFGSRKTNLSPPNPGAPTVTMKSTTIFGDARLYSLSQVPEGRLRKLWRSLRSG
ncbi:MAG: DUF1707 SHOCT-like domain-containing protein [Acidimicrobiales bacterium]